MKKLYFILILLIFASFIFAQDDSLTAEEDSITQVLDTLKMEDLYGKAAMWEVGNARTTVKLARKEMIERGEESIQYIFFEKFLSPGGLEDRANKAVIKGLEDIAVPYIYNCMGDNPVGYIASSIDYIGELKLEAGYDSLLAILPDTTEDRKKLKRLVIRSLGKYGNPEAALHIHETLEDSLEYNRITAVVALGDLKNPESIAPLVNSLDDTLFTVNQAICLALPKFGENALDEIKNALETATGDEKFELIRLVGRFRKDEVKKDAFKILKSYVKDPEPRVRGEAIKGMKAMYPEKTEKITNKLKETETNPFVLWTL